jgi:hypothetical protein
MDKQIKTKRSEKQPMKKAKEKSDKLCVSLIAGIV